MPLLDETLVTADPDPWIGMRVGAYVVERRLGRGGMGAVYAGVRTSDRTPVAVKRMESGDATPRARFRHEVGALLGLTHPNIVALIDSGEADGTAYLVMEIVDGVSLRDTIAAGRLPLLQAAAVAAGIAAALEHAHARGVLHRDIKPDNVMIARDGIAKVVDFGIAKLLGKDATMLTRTGAIVGTPGYVAPELLDDVDFSIQSDLYALGVVLFEMLTADKPYAAGNFMALLAAHALEVVPTIASRGVDVPPTVEKLVASLLAKAPAARPASAAVVHAALDAIGAEGATIAHARSITRADTASMEAEPTQPAAVAPADPSSDYSVVASADTTARKGAIAPATSREEEDAIAYEAGLADWVGADLRANRVPVVAVPTPAPAPPPTFPARTLTVAGALVLSLLVALFFVSTASSPSTATDATTVRERPPQRELKTLKDELDYLTEFCLDRVPCASTATEVAKDFVALSPEKANALLGDIEACVELCRR